MTNSTVTAVTGNREKTAIQASTASTPPVSSEPDSPAPSIINRAARTKARSIAMKLRLRLIPIRPSSSVAAASHKANCRKTSNGSI